MDNQSEIPDIQMEQPRHKIDVDAVGVKDIIYPIEVEDRENKKQNTVAKISMLVELPDHFRGTHMSRFIEVLHCYQQEFSLVNIDKLLHQIKQELQAAKAEIIINFPYFMKKAAPVSKVKSIMDYPCVFYGIDNGTEQQDFILEVNVPVITLCPCSKEISERGAHNQRAVVKIQVRYREFIWIEELIELAETNSSSPVYSLLKRSDEKYITEHAYDHPCFVEDVVRSVSVKLLEDERVTWFKVECESFESIHNHSAYAVIERDKRTARAEDIK